MGGVPNRDHSGSRRLVGGIEGDAVAGDIFRKPPKKERGWPDSHDDLSVSLADV